MCRLRCGSIAGTAVSCLATAAGCKLPYQHRVRELPHPYTFAPCTHHEHTHTCSKSDGVRRCTTERRSRGTQCIPHVFSGLGTCWFRRGGERLSRRGRRGRALGGCRCRLLAVPPTALLLLLAVCVQSEVGIGTLCSRLPRGILHVTTQPSHNHHHHPQPHHHTTKANQPTLVEPCTMGAKQPTHLGCLVRQHCFVVHMQLQLRRPISLPRSRRGGPRPPLLLPLPHRMQPSALRRLRVAASLPQLRGRLLLQVGVACWPEAVLGGLHWCRRCGVAVRCWHASGVSTGGCWLVRP